jgi:integrase
LSTRTKDRGEAEEVKEDIVAKLRLGINPRRNSDDKQGRMTWDVFRDKFYEFNVKRRRDPSAMTGRLDTIERVAKPRYVDELLSNERLNRIESDLLVGLGATSNKIRKSGRKASTVASIMKFLKTALKFAHEMNWIDAECKYRVKDHSTVPKGRPLSDAEVKVMLKAIKTACPHDVDGWSRLVRGILTTGLRLEEIHIMTWDKLGTIRPMKTRSGAVILELPATEQKNGQNQTIGTAPEFPALLDEIPEDERTGFIFNPIPQRQRVDENGDPIRTTADNWGKVISEIGKKSGIVVNADGKFASAHDLRRTFGTRLADAGVSSVDLQAVLRHKSFETTKAFYVQSDAENVTQRLAEKVNPQKYLGTPADEDDRDTEAEEAIETEKHGT